LLVPKLFTTLRAYTRQQFAADLTAGVIVGIVALPLAIAFAIAGGLTPERGLYTAIIAGFLISALGGSRVQIGGPTGAFVVIVAGIVQQYGVDGLLAATLMAGVILVVESDDTTREVIGEVFRCAGHRVLPARNGVEAFDVLQQEPVDCIVSETRVSRLSGEGLYTQVEQRLPHLARRFVFISGDTQEPEVRQFLERSGCLLIPKPFDVELLVEAVDEILEAVALGAQGREAGAAPV